MLTLFRITQVITFPAFYGATRNSLYLSRQQLTAYKAGWHESNAQFCNNGFDQKGKLIESSPYITF
jgi:hypothetical protein